MPNYFETINNIWRKEDAFDEVLNGNLFDAINGLQQIIKGNDPIWAKVVFEILHNYVLGFFFYHFCFSYGDPETYKPERQRDLEQHIHKLLDTEARDLISKVSVSFLHRRGWQTLNRIRPWRLSFTLNPLRLSRRLVWRIFQIFVQRMLKAEGGARMGLELFGLFDHYTAEEFNELLLYVQHHSLNKLPHEFNEWEIFYTVRLMTKSQAILPEEHERLVEQIFNIQFTREDIRIDILAELAKSSDAAVVALSTYKYLDAKHLVTSAHINPLSMKMLILSLASYSSYDMDNLLGKLERLEKSSVEVLLQTDHTEEKVYSSAVLIATHVSALTIEARELLTSHLNSSDYHLRYLAACTLFQTARIAPVERAKVFNPIMEIAIGPKYLEVSQETYNRRDSLQTRAVEFLLDLAENDPLLIRTFLMALRDTWENEFADALRSFFNVSGCEVTDDVIGKLVDHLLDGSLSEVRMSVRQLCSEMHEFLIGFPLDRIASNDLLPYALSDNDSLGADLVRACTAYTIRVWSRLVALVEHISSLKRPHFAVFAAVMVLDKPGRRSPNTYSMPVYRKYETSEDSYVSICQDLCLATHILERLDEASVLKLLTDVECEADDKARERIMWSLRFFPHANHTLISLIKKGLADSERKVCQAAQESLYWLPYLDVDGIELLVETLLSSERKPTATMSNDLVEHLQPIAPSAIPRVVELLRKSSDSASPDSLQKIRSRSDQICEIWLVQYCLNVLKSVQQEGTDFIELYKQKLLVNYSNDDLRRHLRPFLILALGRVRPVTSETVEMLLNFTKPGKARMVIRIVSKVDFAEVKMAAGIALAEIGSDLTNGVDWDMRDAIANHLIWSAKFPLPSRSTFVGGKDIFPKDPNDAMYQSAKTMALVMKDHRAREQVANEGIASLE